ncbi:EAL domain-containing protein [Campylobacter mucosalis]|uniref:EAL domain-containing protein n=1 Tax=Campylobacter mucosalis TaxID=202 RepID=UPI0014703EAD
MKNRFPISTLLSCFVIFVLFAAYIYALDYDRKDLANALSVVFSMSMAIFMLKQLMTCNCVDFKWGNIVASFAVWGFADCIFITYETDTIGDNFILHSVYAMPVFFMFISFISIGYSYFRHSSIIQARIDISVIFIASMGFLLSFLSEQNFANNISNANFFFNTFYIFIDVFIFLSSLFMMFSIRNLSEYKDTRILLIGFAIYGFYDVFYSINDINGKLLDNTFADAMFFIVFIVFFVASLYAKKYKNIRLDENFGVGVLKKTLLLVFMPILKYIFDDNSEMTYIIFMLVLALFYAILSLNIASNTQSRLAIESEKAQKAKLKREIQEYVAKLEHTNNQLNEQSKYDYLTKAYNRPYFLTLLSEMIKTKDLGEQINVYSIDLNRFKTINDSHGHYVGDEVLVKLIESLKEILPPNSIIARFAGDDIAIATKKRELQNDYAEFAQKLLKRIRVPITIDGIKINLSAKIGVGFTQTSQIKVEDLLAKSLAALNKAKSDTKHSFVLYDEELGNTLLQENSIQILLDSVKFDKEFSLVYQPQYEINGKKLIGAEALIRWHSPIKGFISPGLFIPIAEQSSIIVNIGKWVSKKAIEKIAYINKTYNTNLKMSINVSPKQIDSVNFVDNMLDTINSCDVKTSSVCFEITEMSWMSNEEIIKEILQNFQDNGIDVAIDDFGTGFSSLSYINKYKINKLKIAKELVDDIQTDDVSKDVVRAIIALAKTLGIKTIAEGVESEEQLEILRDFGCDEVQGYVWSKPLHEADFEALVQRMSGRA